MKTYTELFVPGMFVNIVLDGYCDRYSDVDLNLYVYDSAGKIVAKSENPTCWEEISFSPKRKQRYEIVVRSIDSVAKMDYAVKISTDVQEGDEQ